ncbi:hypothetical protein L6452_45049 [Arctium lappa]|nr:hypothetical protein L6452_45049 [Arctium lappa]
MHLLDKRSTRALPVAAMIHDNSTDRTAFVPATHHSNFCPINFRCLLTSYVEVSLHGQLLRGTMAFQARKFEAITVCDALRCSGPHARYTDIIAIVGLKRGIPSKRESSARVDYFLNASCARSHSAEGTSAWASRIASPPTTPPQWGCVSFGAETGLPCPWCGWPKKESPLTDARLVVVVKAFVSSRADAREALSNDPNVSSCNDASTADPREADGGRRCVPVGCGTARAGPPIDSGRGPVRIGAAAKARAVDMPVEMPSRRSWLAARAVTACLGHLRAPRHRPAGTPFGPS